MKPARIQKTFVQPHSWQQLKNGQWVFESIQTRLDEWCPKLFGYHMLKLGGLSCELVTHNCNIKHQVNVDTLNPLHNVIADAYDLPFVEKSIDTALVCHQLDYCSDPHRLLREVDRIIIDDGYMILTGFNPVSLTGISSLMPWRKNNLPWSGRMFSPYRIKDWLGLLNYEVMHCDTYALFPVKKGKAITTWLEHSLGGCASAFGSVYFIVAKKRTYPLRPIKPHWKLKRGNLSPASVGFNKQASEKTNKQASSKLR